MAMGRRDAMTCGGCLVSAVGATGAVLAWGMSDRTRRHFGHAFENNGMDLSVLCTELPFALLAGALAPALIWALGAWLLERRRRSDLHS